MRMSYKDLTVFRRWNDGECKGNHWTFSYFQASELV